MNGKLAWCTYCLTCLKYLLAFLATTFLVYMFLQMYFWFNPSKMNGTFFYQMLTPTTQQLEKQTNDFSGSLQDYRRERAQKASGKK
jgi:hypothetical protein